ncbi:RICIN domain-containing protein [Streptomyces sediminimaris]|uniref:RICIN domain-containing protein n=1 Tax=Streptomyces sediminimaris TaxID=3383721 RepID=UPI00399B7439
MTAPTPGPPAATSSLPKHTHSDTHADKNVNSDATITAVQSGLCLDADKQGTADGTKVQLWSCTGGANQQWSFRN